MFPKEQLTCPHCNRIQVAIDINRRFDSCFHKIMHFRKAHPNDIDRINCIIWHSKSHWNYPTEWMEEFKTDLLMTPQTMQAETVWMLEHQKEIIGLYYFQQEAESVHLNGFWILPEFIGKGHGKKLFQHFLEMVKQLTVNRIEIVADPNAEGFYKHMGATKFKDQPSQIPGRFLPVLEMVI